jgi:catalase-peroxidase
VSSPTRPGTLTNDFFVNLLDMRTKWQKSGRRRRARRRDRSTGARKWTGTVVDLVFGSNSQLRGIAEQSTRLQRFATDLCSCATSSSG